MPRDNLQPNAAEWKVLNALWRKHPSTAVDLLELVRNEGWVAATLKTMLGRMQDKGFIRVELRGNANWYEPALEQSAAQRNAVRRLPERVFEGPARPAPARPKVTRNRAH